VSGLSDCVFYALMHQLGWHDEWYLAAVIDVSNPVKFFLAGAPVKVSRGLVVDVFLQVWVVNL
jgi:hypothetical protein